MEDKHAGWLAGVLKTTWSDGEQTGMALETDEAFKARTEV